MSTLKTNKFQHIDASGTNTNIELDSSRNVTVKGNLTVDGTSNVGVGGATAVTFNDNVKSNWGTGADFQIWSTGTDSIIRHTNSGSGEDLILESDTATIIGKTSVNGGDVGVKFIADGAVELYYNNAKCLETKDLGVEIQKEAIIRGVEDGDARLYLYADEADDNADKWQIGAATQGHLYIQSYNSGSWVDSIKCFGTGQLGVEMGTSYTYYNKSNTGVIVEFRTGGVAKGNIGIGGSDVSYNETSDYRLKENVAPITDGITRVKQLKPSKFNWIADDTNTLIDGFLAHEVSSVVPNAVTGAKDAVDLDDKPVHQVIAPSKMIPLLTAALKEAITKIETLETKVAALEAG